MAQINVNTTSSTFGSLLTQYDQLVAYSISVDPGITTFYLGEDALVSACYSAFYDFDTAVADGDVSSYSLPR